MTRSIAAAILAAVLVASATACDPAPTRSTRKSPPRPIVQTNPILRLMAQAEVLERRLVKEAGNLAPLLAFCQPRVAEFVWELGNKDPNVRMNQLLNESEDLRKARQEMHRFWMNNQPSMLTFERLQGAIGP